MFTENEVALMLENERVLKGTQELKQDFVSTEVKYLEISDHDFLSLILLTPAVGIALANGSVSLFEEFALNKKARILSKGGYFMQKDPVVVAMGFFIKKYSDWEMKFVEFLKTVLKESVDLTELDTAESEENVDPQKYRVAVLKAPYAFIRFFSSFFCSEDIDMLETENRSIVKVDYEKVLDLGEKLEFNKYSIFRHFCATYSVR